MTYAFNLSNTYWKINIITPSIISVILLTIVTYSHAQVINGDQFNYEIYISEICIIDDLDLNEDEWVATFLSATDDNAFGDNLGDPGLCGKTWQINGVGNCETFPDDDDNGINDALANIKIETDENANPNGYFAVDITLRSYEDDTSADDSEDDCFGCSCANSLDGDVTESALLIFDKDQDGGTFTFDNDFCTVSLKAFYRYSHGTSFNDPLEFGTLPSSGNRSHTNHAKAKSTQPNAPTSTCCGTHSPSVINYNNQSVFYSFTIAQTSSVQLYTNPTKTDSDAMLEVYNSAANIIASDDNSGTGNNPFINIILQPGVYRVKVKMGLIFLVKQADLI